MSNKDDKPRRPRTRLCTECNGSGYHDRIDVWRVPCPCCGATGRIVVQKREVRRG